MLDLKVNVFFSFFFPKQTSHAQKLFLELNSSSVNTSFAKFTEKSIVGKLLLSYLKEVTFFFLWIDFGKIANFFIYEK